MNKTTFTIADDKKTLLMERTFNTSGSKLWQAYADPSILAQWFSPQGWSTEVKKHDFTNGGEYVYVMKCEDTAQGEWFGKTSSGKMVFSNISPETSFEYKDYFTNEEGVVNESLPAATSTVRITDNANGTATLNVETTYQSEADLNTVLEMGMQEGYSQTLDKLEGLLAQ
ncbi:MAG: SRPBCC domain-containing protein [Candidatus Kerfeldbacteria bacterium]|nr:SRPBCC domain-containing protein [Candidatus Kerfeldbacteria bacterium]